MPSVWSRFLGSLRQVFACCFPHLKEERLQEEGQEWEQGQGELDGRDKVRTIAILLLFQIPRRPQ